MAVKRLKGMKQLNKWNVLTVPTEAIRMSNSTTDTSTMPVTEENRLILFRRGHERILKRIQDRDMGDWI